MSTIKDFLNNSKTTGAHFTHISMVNIKGKYAISSSRNDTFWELYQDAVYDGDSVMGLAERTKNYPYVPVIGDIDIKIKIEKEDDKNIQHSEKHVRETVQIYQNVIKKVVDQLVDVHLFCFVLKRKPYITQDKKYIKHGFHLHFPYTFIKKEEQQRYMIPMIKKIIKEKNVFKDIGILDSSSVIDDCLNNAWLLYGSTKDINIKPYKVDTIYNNNMRKISLEQALEGYKIYDSDEELIDIDAEFKYYLPQILSVNPHNRPLCEFIVPETKQKITNLLINKKKKSKTNDKSKLVSIRDLTDIIVLINPSRSDDYHSWLRIGWCIFNCTNGSEDGLELWCDFSKNSDKYDENYNISLWEKMVNKDVTIGTLKYYAKIDNPEKFKKYKMEKIKENEDSWIDGSNTAIATLLYELYKDEFVCSSIANHTWYKWDGNRWKYIEKGIDLRKKISTQIVTVFSELGKQTFSMMAAEQSNHKMIMLKERIKELNKVISNCKSASFKNRVMEECEEQFYNPLFKEKLDSNPILFPFKNGIYDLRTNIFRNSEPSDYISKTANVNYDNSLSFKSESVKDVKKHLEMVFPDETVRTYFVDVTSDIFEGGNMRKHGYFWTGRGNNGKSVTQNLIEEMLGPYDIVLPTTIITGKKISNGSANPELARAGGGVRRVTVAEPSKEELINNGTYKNLTGNDKFFARDLFEKGKEVREITPMFKFTVICNKLPKFRDPNDGGIWVRARVIPFESKFLRPGEDYVPDTYEDQLKEKRFPVDTNFSKKIPGMATAFAWYLLEHRKNMKGKMIVEPPKVMQATNEYKRQSDTYRQFEEEKIEDEMEQKTGQLSIITLTEIYSCFKEWFRDSIPHNTVPIKNDVKEYFLTHWKENRRLKGNRWKGYRIKNEFYNQDE
jgi:P4 family phage/plasmid primase-like protien